MGALGALTRRLPPVTFCRDGASMNHVGDAFGNPGPPPNGALMPDLPDDPRDAPTQSRPAGLPRALRIRRGRATRAVSTSRPFDPESDLPGAVFMVPQSSLGFESLPRTLTPGGACVHYQAPDGRQSLVKGTLPRNGPAFLRS